MRTERSAADLQALILNLLFKNTYNINTKTHNGQLSVVAIKSHNPFKIYLHTYICIETGEMMGEGSSNKGQTKKSLKQLMKGFTPSTYIIANSYVRSLARKLPPEVEEPRRPKPVPAGPEIRTPIMPGPPPEVQIREKESSLPDVLRDQLVQTEDRFSHPALPNKTFTAEQTYVAFELVIAAEKAILNDDQDVYSELTPSREKILRSLMELPYFVDAVKKHHADKALRVTLEELNIDVELNNLRNSDPEVNTDEVRKRIDEWRKSSPDSLAPESLLGASIVEWAVATLKDEQGNRMTGVYKSPSEVPPSEPELVGNVKLAMEITEEMERGTEPKSQRILRAEQILAANREMSPFEVALEVARELELGKIAEKALELVFNFPNYALDEELESALPKEKDEHSALVRRVARILTLYTKSRMPFKDVPEVYQNEVAVLRKSYSIADTVRFATDLADMALGKKPSQPPTIKPVPIDVVAYDAQLSLLDFDQLDFLMQHFGSERPDEKTFTNVLVVFRRTKHLNEENPARADVQTIAGYYDRDTGIIVDDAEPGTEAFDLRLNMETGCLGVVSGWENPSIACLDGLQVLTPSTLSEPSLDDSQKTIVLAALQKSEEFSDSDLDEFKKMHPGVRELRIRNFLSSKWGANEYAQLAGYEAAADALLELCKTAIAAEKREALLDRRNLSEVQLNLVETMFGVPAEALEQKHLLGMAVWMAGNSDELRSYWEKHYLDVGKVSDLAEALKERRPKLDKTQKALLAVILNKGPKERIGSKDKKRVAEVEHYLDVLKQRHHFWFSSTREERNNFWKRGSTSLLTVGTLAHRLRFGSPDAEYSHEESTVLSLACKQPADEIDEDEMDELRKAFANKTEDSIYYSELMRLHRLFKTPEFSSLQGVAQRESEYRIMLDFAGFSMPVPRAYIDQRIGASVQHGVVNEDAFSCVRIGDDITLKAVFDGMGGHESGDLASKRAKEVFEISALAGWIKSAEDVRRTIVLIDIAIAMDQISKKSYPDNDHLESNMGTTAVITIKKGNEFYGVHCGDSLYKIIRQGKVVHEAEAHDTAYEYKQAGIPMDPSKARRNVISSGLGIASTYITINNKAHDPEPFVLEEGDLEVVASDGITDIVSDGEYEKVIAQCSGRLSSACDEAIKLATQRSSKKTRYQTLTGTEVVGKNDDKTLLLERHGREFE